MHDIIFTMLEKYKCESFQDYTNALKEIIQEIALLGLWRSKFFDKAAFYGGTSLRILYGLDRFSEDLDFSLMHRNDAFDLDPFNRAVQKELEAFGFQMEVEPIIKKKTQIVSAFIKGGTQVQLLNINAPHAYTKFIPKGQLLQMKMEVDTDPPPDFRTETKILLQPIPFSVTHYALEDSFAGKMHALLCRKWEKRVKGRDWYDFVWFIARQVPLHIKHLEARLIQSGHWPAGKLLTEHDLQEKLQEKIKALNIVQAKQDVERFLRSVAATALWSTEFFNDLAQRIKVV
ncbi:MAG: nucleotidyl transferase AbiEii/AbiGii toxin family protein [Gammaproteobacteria bacterium]